MPKVQSINQNPVADVLPNFRSLGAILRIVLLVNGVAMTVAAAQSQSLTQAIEHFVSMSAYLQPVLLTSLLLLFALHPLLLQLRYWYGVLVITMLVASASLEIFMLGGDIYQPGGANWGFLAARNAVLGALGSMALLAYFRLRAQALSPAVHNARLQALQARIRPHFLFNSINAVLSIVRADPRRAETALEDMSDLFRMAMADGQDLVPLRREVELSRQYLALEQMRLGDRLAINWKVDDTANNALVPPLMLQPLLENAVYHGIEPLEQGGTIDIELRREGDDLHLDVRNPNATQGDRHKGNKMALENIRERLALQFDIEARYVVEVTNVVYHVHIFMPYIKEEV